MPSRSATALRPASAPEAARLRPARPTVFAPGAEPRVWVLSSPRAGERTQLLALAEALGCPYEIKQIAHRPMGSVVELLGGEHLLGIDERPSAARAQRLEQPLLEGGVASGAAAPAAGVGAPADVVPRARPRLAPRHRAPAARAGLRRQVAGHPASMRPPSRPRIRSAAHATGRSGQEP